MEELEDSIVSGCICGKAHTRDCPLNPRNKHTGPPKLGDKKKKKPRAKDERRPVSRSLGQETTCQYTRDIFRGNTFCVG